MWNSLKPLPGMLLMTDEAENELTLRFNESDVMHPIVLTNEVVQHFYVQQL